MKTGNPKGPQLLVDEGITEIVDVGVVGSVTYFSPIKRFPNVSVKPNVGMLNNE
jgi:hypothetical protein